MGSRFARPLLTARFWLVAASLSFMTLPIMNGTAHAQAESTITQEPFSNDSWDPGCRQTDLIHAEGVQRFHQVEVNGRLQIQGLAMGTVTFTEDGQSFLGRFEYPFNRSLPVTGGAVVATDEFTLTAKGDLGDVAMLHVITHTVTTTSGITTVSFFYLLHHCS